ncbi:hypothetical protein LRP67_19940 [Nocardioides sp. cx-169]|uniref:hypothetical protein n=1 Tax=Nocardioides sp. cx-169 TaxID=2899080 RepID=UPI001E31275F|nr:hypothetical protein [Nocardioides sp. cx-169]MCD4536370.1 hypothetical protein [Nocardioides sp. cx-169]
MTVTDVTTFPVFTGGQTLTADELNDEHEHLVARDRVLGRTLGFGIACGLTGTVNTAGTELTIAGGLCVDQRGEAMLLTPEAAAAQGRIPLEPTVTPDESFPFVTGTDGYSVVLVARHLEGERAGCGEDGCAGHSRLDSLRPEVVVVRGRLEAQTTDFSQESLLTGFTPMTIAGTGTITGPFVSLKGAIVERVGDALTPAARQKLSDLALNGTDLLALQQYKAAYLNQVYFAALDLLRFRALVKVTCLRDTATPGVVLGWVTRVGGTWTWDCAHRHHWEPPTGLTQALLGGTCQSPDQLWVDRLNNVVLSFNPPSPPKPADPPSTFDPGLVHLCKSKKCELYPYPGKVLIPDWRTRWTEVRPIWVDPLWDPDPTTEWVFEDAYHDVTLAGHLVLTDLVGTPAIAVMDEVSKHILATGVQPQVAVITQQDAAKNKAIAFTGAVTPDDQIMLVKDDQGKLVGVGRIAAAKTLQQVGTALPLATSQAQAAYDATQGFETELATVQVGLGTVQQAQQGLDRWRATVEVDLRDVLPRVRTQVASLLAEHQLTVSTVVDDLVGDKVSAVVSGYEEVLKQHGEALITVQEQVGSAQQELNRYTGRIDTLYSKTMLKDLGGREAVVGSGVVEVMRTMRDALEATATDDQRDRIRPHLAAADDGLARMEATIAAGGSGLDENPATLTNVLTSLADGLAGVGAPAAQVKAVRAQAAALERQLQR